jgi:regulator of RNase E activity RraA
MPLDRTAIDTLRTVSTATITTVLLKKGLRNVWIRGARPIRTGQPRLVGPAFTLRFVPAREDLATPESWGNPISTRAAIEAMPEGVIAVIDAMGVQDAGVFGDILCARMAKRNVAAMVTDGVVRDLAGVLSTNLPIWCSGVAAPSSVTGLTFVGWNEPIGCGGVAVYPDDVIVADDDGAAASPFIRTTSSSPTTTAPFSSRGRCWITSSPLRQSRSAWRPGSWRRSRAAKSFPASTP